MIIYDKQSCLLSMKTVVIQNSEEYYPLANIVALLSLLTILRLDYKCSSMTNSYTNFFSNRFLFGILIITIF